MSKVNENIRKFRTFRGMSQKEIAGKLNKSTNVISNWENGIHSPDIDMIQDLCKILRVTPNQLFGWEENPDYEAYYNRIMAYQEKISELMSQKKDIEKEIHDLEVKKFEECPPDWA